MFCLISPRYKDGSIYKGPIDPNRKPHGKGEMWVPMDSDHSLITHKKSPLFSLDTPATPASQDPARQLSIRASIRSETQHESEGQAPSLNGSSSGILRSGSKRGRSLAPELLDADRDTQLRRSIGDLMMEEKEREIEEERKREEAEKHETPNVYKKISSTWMHGEHSLSHVNEHVGVVIDLKGKCEFPNGNEYRGCLKNFSMYLN